MFLFLITQDQAWLIDLQRFVTDIKIFVSKRGIGCTFYFNFRIFKRSCIFFSGYVCACTEMCHIFGACAQDLTYLHSMCTEGDIPLAHGMEIRHFFRVCAQRCCISSVHVYRDVVYLSFEACLQTYFQNSSFTNTFLCNC